MVCKYIFNMALIMVILGFIGLSSASDVNSIKSTIMELKNDKLFFPELRGHNIFVSFWATTCYVCLKEFNETKKERKSLSDSGIVFVYVAVDDNDSAWKSAILKYELNGFHVLCTNEHPIFEKYNIYYFPQHVILNKKGEIIEWGKGLKKIKVNDWKRRKM